MTVTTPAEDEKIVRDFLEKHSDDPYITSESEAAFNRLMLRFVWKKQ